MALQQDKVGEMFVEFQKQAKEKLAHFNNDLGGKKGSNSMHYQSMINALEGVANIGEGDSPEAIAEAMDRLQKASKDYVRQRGGFGSMFRSSSGKDRIKAANDLLNFCNDSGKDLRDLAQSDKYKNYLKQKAQEAKEAEARRRKAAAEEEAKRKEEYNKEKTAEAQRRRGSSSVEVDYVMDLKEKAAEQLEALKAGMDPNHKNSEVYTKMVNALENVAQLENWSSMDDAKRALNSLEVASENYIKARKGAFKSASGKARLEQASGLLGFAKGSMDNLERSKVDLRIEKYQSHLRDISGLEFYSNETNQQGIDDFDYRLAQVMMADTLKESVFNGETTLEKGHWRITQAAEKLCRTDTTFQKWAKDLREQGIEAKQAIASKTPKQIRAEFAKQKALTDQKEATAEKNTPSRQVEKQAQKNAAMGMA